MKNIKIEKVRGTNTFTVHSNFSLLENRALLNCVENIEGVEYVYTEHIRKYSFNVDIGRLFDINEVMEKIKQILLNYQEVHANSR